jgi:DNA-binding NtrC family response regulator
MTHHTVLVVDDQESIRDLWTRVLISEGYGVLSAADAFDALRLLGESRPTVAVCDVHLPGPSGVWLAEMIRKQSPYTAIVLASGDPFVPPRETVKRAVVAYIIKPFTRGELLAAVEEGVTWSREQIASR